jgi:hypothetical protein
MGMTRNTLVALSLAAALSACGSEAVESPVGPSSAPASPSASVSTAPPAPVMPDAAKAHTQDGAKAFIVYYWQVVDYAQQTLDVTGLQRLSLPTCVGCNGGIEAITQIASAGGHYVGGGNEITVSGGSDSVHPGKPITFAIEVSNGAQQEVVPGKKTKNHPAATTHMITTLISNSDSWSVSELRAQT